jgi:hypothetical protein
LKAIIPSFQSQSHAKELNNIKINGTPIYDDRVLPAHGIDRFCGPNFQNSEPSQRPNSNSNSSCSALNLTVNSSGSFEQAVKALKHGGYSVMASFLRMKLSGNTNQNGITAFTPMDEMVMNRIGGFRDYPSPFRRHVVPCKASMERSGGFW